MRDRHEMLQWPAGATGLVVAAVGALMLIAVIFGGRNQGHRAPAELRLTRPASIVQPAHPAVPNVRVAPFADSYSPLRGSDPLNPSVSSSLRR